MSVIPNPFKQAEEFIFSRKWKKYYPLLVSNNSNILQTTSQKHLDIKLGAWLDFREHLKWGEKKTDKTFGFLHKLQNISPKAALIAIYIAFLSPI